MTHDGARVRERLTSAIAVALCHALLGYALLCGFRLGEARESVDELKLFDVPAEPPPPDPPEPVPAKAVKYPRAAASANVTAEPAAFAPPPVIRLPVPPPIVTAPASGSASAASAGAASREGPGTGAGGVGAGVGGGRAGSGDGGIVAHARLIRGRIENGDYPRRAWNAGAAGAVTVRFTVGADGSATGCAVTASSGHPDLDATTCRLIERRFRYAPARDASGRTVAEERGWRQLWWIE